MLFNIHTLNWDEDLMKLFGIPMSMLPEVHSSSEIYGYTKTTIFAHKVPVAGIAGDQQAALFGQMCTTPGSVKNTYGTGCFLLMNSGLGIIKSSSEIESLAMTVPDNGGVYFVPALTGLGAPYWDQYAKGTICGLTRGTTAAHIARAALEGIAFETMDIVNAMEHDAGIEETLV